MAEQIWDPTRLLHVERVPVVLLPGYSSRDPVGCRSLCQPMTSKGR
jgi:hypothetical protein